MPALRPRWPSCAVRRGVSIRSRSLAPRGAAAATGAVKGAAAAEEAVGVLEGAAAAKGAMEAEEVVASAKAAVEVKESMENAAAVGVVMVREAVVREAVVREAVVREAVVREIVAAVVAATVGRCRRRRARAWWAHRSSPPRPRCACAPLGGTRWRSPCCAC